MESSNNTENDRDLIDRLIVVLAAIATVCAFLDTDGALQPILAITLFTIATTSQKQSAWAPKMLKRVDQRYTAITALLVYVILSIWRIYATK